MIKHFLVVATLALSLPVAASAEDRTVGVGSFSRIRIEGGFDVRVLDGSPRARISGERSAIEAVDLQVSGTTLVIRRSINSSWSERPVTAGRGAVTIALTTSGLEAATVTGGARVEIARMRGRRVDLSVAGAGGITVANVRADQVVAQVVGAGSIALAGTTGSARLTTNGPGTIDADKLDAGDLVVRLDGLGATTARARYTATIDNSGLGLVSVAGSPKCTVRAGAGGPVACGRSGVR